MTQRTGRVALSLLLSATTVILILHAASEARGQTIDIIAPNAFETIEAPMSFSFPLGRTPSTPVRTLRFQQVIESSEFGALTTGSHSLTAIAFRPDPALPFIGGSTSFTISDLQIRISTTAVGAAGLSSTFANNIGGDELLVFSGPLSVQTFMTGVGPLDFDIVIQLTAPFSYDPTAGNLLLDFVNNDLSNVFLVDADKSAGPSSMVYTDGATGSSSDTTGRSPEAGGPIVELRFIPEPSVILQAMTAMVTLVLLFPFTGASDGNHRWCNRLEGATGRTGA